MVRTPPERETSTSSCSTPASSQRITRSSPFANMSAVGTQAVAWVLLWSSCPPPSAYSRILAISLMWSMSPRNGLRVLPIFPPYVVSVGIGSTLVASFGSDLRRFQILGYRRTHPAYRTPGNEDRLALHLTRFIRVSEPQLAHLPEGHQLPVLGACSAEYYVLPNP